MRDSGSNKKVANSLLALSSAAVLAVYAAGYVRTRAAADRFTVQAEGRRPVIPPPDSSSAPPPVVAPISTPAPPKPEATRKKPRPAAARPTPKPAGDAQQTAPATTPVVTATAPAPVVPAPPASPEPPPAPVAPPKPVYKDGTYLGWGTSRHGDIQAQVVIEDGRIKAATIAQCLTRYSCNVIVNLPPQVAQRQSPETDYVSGATQSTNAFYYAVVEALSKAK